MAGRDGCSVLLNTGGQRVLAAAGTAAAVSVEQEVAHRPTLDKGGELGCRQDGVAAGEATQRHDGLVGLQDDGVRLVRADYSNKVFRIAFVRFQVFDERGICSAVASSKTSAGLPARPGDRQVCRLIRQHGDSRPYCRGEHERQ